MTGESLEAPVLDFGKILGLATRNAIQVLIPVLALVATGEITGAGAATIGVGMILAFVSSLGKSAMRWHAAPTAAWYWRLLDRVAPASIGALLAVWPADLGGLLVTDWRGVAASVGGAGLTAGVMWALEILPAEQANIG